MLTEGEVRDTVTERVAEHIWAQVQAAAPDGDVYDRSDFLGLAERLKKMVLEGRAEASGEVVAAGTCPSCNANVCACGHHWERHPGPYHCSDCDCHEYRRHPSTGESDE